MAALDPDRVRRLPSDREPTAAKIARLEELIESTSDDIHALKEASVESIRMLDNRLHELEDVRVRALEDWRLSQRVLEKERERVAAEERTRSDTAQANAQQTADDALEHARQRITKKQFWLGTVGGTLLLAAVTIVGALIASGRLF